ncbi:EAL domain-containing protein [Dechloromonas denitrificans]|uniref:putative bifunctional diguanylate cyclase/phosphodiesterase n=1 Tax=Dechloromonas denitrificans TaxID=281362 RepID=UPI001CF90DCE|nr:EAL domain-containing protein [Dechloromonas denitrificans]UCV12351.1 EAL domain-containing protein [Dechloromonas denitrificans]
MIHNPVVAGRRLIAVSLSVIALLWLSAVFGLADWHASPLSATSLVSFLLLACAGFSAYLLRHAGQQLELHRTLVSHSSEAIMLTDANLRIVAVNPAFERITDFSAADVIGNKPSILSSGRHGPDFYQSMWTAIRESCRWEGEIWNRRKGGEIYPQQLTISAIRQGRRETLTHYVAVFADLSARKAQEARIEYMAHHDPLTGLPNRLALNQLLESAIPAIRRNAGQLAVLVIDLDNFKTVNDSLGHHAGDKLLCEVASRLRRVLGAGEHVMRLGGDEFVVVLEAFTCESRVVEVVHQLVREVSEPCLVDGCELHTSPSIGIALFPNDGDSPETLIRNADTAMYYAKSTGRNNYQFFAAPMNAAANKRLHLENELWKALAERQLVLHYQPQVDLPSGRVVGLEALVRWQHPERGMIPPADFIPVAEESGLILPLGHWVLRTACEQARAWLDQGIDLGEIAVNISALQFRQPEFAQSVKAILDETGLPASRLELEITESVVMHSADSSISVLNELKAMGVKLAIDDFGTGYSSLSYLRRFPVDRLKIDHSFVADVESDGDAASLVSSIIALGRSLGLNLVAEGVESPGQAAFLRDMACERVQGFHFFRPVAADKIVELDAFLGATAKKH